ncbi:MAG: regulator of sirC expression with transglutaminase-like and TPR domain, partial [Myxococcota bacterium]
MTLLTEHGDDIPLDVAAACLAAEEQPGVSADAILTSLDALAAEIRLPAGLGLTDAIARINHHLFSQLGFAGDRETYDEPAN